MAQRFGVVMVATLPVLIVGCTHTVVFTNRSDEAVTVRGTEPAPLPVMFSDREKLITLQPGESATLKIKHGAPIELEGRYSLEIK